MPLSLFIKRLFVAPSKSQDSCRSLAGVSLLLGLAGAGLLPASAHAQTVFGDSTVYPLPARAIALLQGDFNGDGKADLAALIPGPAGLNQRPTDGSVAVLLNTGGRTFAPAKVVSAGLDPTAFAAGDFNNDKKLDLFILHRSTGIATLVSGNGDGTFSGRTDFLTGPSPTSVVSGDFNHDGYADVAISDYGTYTPGGIAKDPHVSQDGKIEVWYTKIARGFVQFDTLDLTSSDPAVMTNPLAVIPIDLGGNGVTDYVAGGGFHSSYPDPVSLGSLNAVQIKNGSYGSPYTASTLAAGEFVALGTGDFNGDGLADLAALSNSNLNLFSGGGNGPVKIWLNTKDGLIAQPDVPGGGTTIRSADMNGDGKADLIVGGLAVYLSNGDGTFQDPEQTTIPNTYDPQGLELNDFDGDGHLDAALSGTGYHTDPSQPNTSIPDYEIAVAWGEPRKETLFAPPVKTPQPSQTTGYSDYSPVPFSADFNHDGISDLAFIRNGHYENGDPYGSFASVFYGDRNGQYRIEDAGDIYRSKGHTGLFPELYVGDFNGDGNMDLIVDYEGAFTRERLYQILWGFQGGFREGALLPYDGFVSYAGTGDFNGDGKTDLMAGQELLLSKGDGTFETVFPDPFFEDVPFRLGRTISGDFNGDGKADYIFPDDTYTGKFTVFLGNAQGSLKQPITQQLEPYSVFFAVGDLTGDGKADLLGTVVADPVKHLKIEPGHGDGTFGPALELPLEEAGVGDVQIADFNLDGVPDFAYVGTTGVATVMFGTGNGGFRKDTERHYVPFGDNVVRGDYNGDGKPDLAYVGLRNISVRLNVTGGVVSGFKGDLDSDGKVTVADAILSLKWVVGLGHTLSLEEVAVGDMDGDRAVTVKDTLLILRTAVGLH